MRLTLRTLLAFMDDILEPQDQEDLARQIEESEKGTELMHRTRDSMRRLRLGAPPVLGEGMELDPNYTSEYLDSTLSAEKMSEYQQVCLESEVHLAEVASCHHILTMVLGEPAEIDPDMRRRMYQIPERIAGGTTTQRVDPAHHSPATTDAASPPSVAVASAAVRRQVDDLPTTEVPDYLRAGRRNTANRMLVAALALLVVGAGAFLLVGPNGMLRESAPPVAQDQDTPTTPPETSDAAPPATADSTQNQDPSATAPPIDPTTDASTPPAANEQSPLPPLNFDEPAAQDASPEGETAPADDSASRPEESMPTETTTEEATTEEPGGVEATPEPSTPEETPQGAAASPPLIPPPASEEPSNDQPTAEDPPLLPPAETTRPEPDAPATDTAPLLPPAGASTDPATGGPPADSPPGNSNLPPAGQAPATPTPPAAASPLATLTTPQEILLRYDPASESWLRMGPYATVNSGDRLLALPTYRPALALTSGCRLELSDGTEATLVYSDDGAMPRLDITYGRILAVNTGMEITTLELQIGDSRRKVEITPAKTFAIEVVRPFVPGQPLDQESDRYEAEIYVPQGGAVWHADGEEIPIDASLQWRWGAGPNSGSPVSKEARWLTGQHLDLIDRKASQNIEQAFTLERPARQQLLEFYETSRRREEKVLAARASTHVGQFVPFVEALADTNQRSNWDSHIEDLRSAMARSPETAEQVRQTLVEQRGTAGGMADDLFEMLRGYSPDQLGSTPEEIQNGVLRKLIDWLLHDRLEYRVLAFHNLKQITGKSFLYNPADTDVDRRNREFRRFQRMLDDNELVPVDR